MGLFLDTLLCPIYLSILMPVQYYFDYFNFVMYFEIR